MRAGEEAGNYFASTKTRKSSPTAKPKLNDVPASQSTTDAAGNLQELTQLKAMRGMDAKRRYGSPSPTTRESSRPPAAAQRSIPGDSPQNSEIAFRRPSQLIEEKSTARAPITFDGRVFAQKLPEQDNVPTLFSHGLDGLPGEHRNSFVLPTSRARLSGRQVSQQRAPRGSLSRKVSFPLRIADLIKVVSLTTFSSNGDDSRPCAHRGKRMGHGHRPFALEDLDILADRRRLERRAHGRLHSIRRSSSCANDAGSASTTNQQHALWMQDIGSQLVSDGAPRERLVSFLDGELSLALKRTAGVCLMVMALAATLFLATLLTQHDLLREPSTFVPQDTELDNTDVNRSTAILHPSLETKEWTTLAAGDYGNVGTFGLYADETAVTDAQLEREVFSEGGEDPTHSMMHPNRM